MELKRREVQDFASAIAATKSLTKFKREVGRDEVRRLTIIGTVIGIKTSF